jgi:hypothetical protein
VNGLASTTNQSGNLTETKKLVETRKKKTLWRPKRRGKPKKTMHVVFEVVPACTWSEHRWESIAEGFRERLLNTVAGSQMERDGVMESRRGLF